MIRNDKYPLSWDEVSFADIRYVIEQACEPYLANPIVQASFLAEHAYDNPGLAAKNSNPEDTAVSKVVKGQLRKYENVEKKRLTTQLNGIDGGYLLGAAAMIGSLPSIGYSDPITAPGLYDREIEWLSSFPLPSAGKTPRWQEVFEAVETARRCLIANMYCQMPDDPPLKKLRDHSVFAKDLGGTYVPISQDMTARLMTLLKENSHKAYQSHLSSFKNETEAILTDYIKKISAIVDQVTIGATQMDRQINLIDKIVDTWSVSEIIELTALDDGVSATTCANDLTTKISNSDLNLRAKPLLKIRDLTVLAFPRRISCELHEILDLAVARHLQSTGKERGNYSDLRASMLDQLIADSLSRLLPGSTLIVGQNWSINGATLERDVVALYEDIAVCIETKAPQMVPSIRANRRDVVSVLRDDASEGVRQVSSIANALETGKASLAANHRQIKVRRAYRLVATFNSWWGIDMDAELLVEGGILPETDAAMLTSADKFVCYEKLFPSPSDFISFLDHRNSHQRRTWLKVSDEFEMIGGYFTNPRGEWLREPPPDTQYLVKDSFQGDVTQTIKDSYLTNGRRSEWLQRKHRRLFLHNLSQWEIHKPKGWLLAFSSVSRLPYETQLEIEIILTNARRTGDKLIQSKRLPNSSCTLAIVFDTSGNSQMEWANFLRNSELNIPIVAISYDGQSILATRGVDEREIWVDPNWNQNNTTTFSERSQKRSPRRQRWQPKRSGSRNKRSNP